jgi:hypothetical protein
MAIGVAEPEVNDFDVLVVIKQEILGLQVSVDNVQLVDILNAGVYLLEKLAGLVLLQTSVCYDIVEELTSTGVLHDEVQLLGRFNDLIELNDVWVTDQL